MITLRKASLLAVMLLAVLMASALNINVTLADEDTEPTVSFTAASAARDGDSLLPADLEALSSPNAQENALPACAVKLSDFEPAWEYERMTFTPCVDGQAGTYLCENVDLLAAMPLGTIGGGGGNDIWGWVDSTTQKEYALMGRTNGTSFVDITDPENPVYLGNLPSHTGSSTWRDIKVYSDHAFIVSDYNANHGMQVFDLTQLRNVANPPATFSETAHYDNIGSAHNIAINEETGFAYIIGGSSGAEECNGGLHMVNIQNPTAPTFAGCYSSDGYTHDTQCVTYGGADAEHQGKEICFSSNEDTLTITDVTNKNSPLLLSRTSYTGASYSHQGWLTEDHRYFLLDDELDEGGGAMTATYVWDIADLDMPVHTGTHAGTTTAIDHNQYVKGDYSYQANYRAGLRIVDISDVANANLEEVAYFDIYPTNNLPNFNGSWSNFPYFPSGNVIISGMEQGLIVVRPNLAPPTAVDLATLSSAPAASPNFALIAGIALAGIAVAGVALRRRA